jgi:hypothetical protein
MYALKLLPKEFAPAQRGIGRPWLLSSMQNARANEATKGSEEKVQHICMRSCEGVDEEWGRPEGLKRVERRLRTPVGSSEYASARARFFTNSVARSHSDCSMEPCWLQSMRCDQYLVPST